MKTLTPFILILLFSVITLYAQVPRTISFQGVLADAQGNLVPDGNHQLQIILYDQASGGNQVFVENQTVPVVKGIFNVIIGSVSAIPQSLNFDRAYFLGVSVDGGSELTPRTTLTSVPYALRAERANIAESLSPTAAVVTHVNNQSGDVTLRGAGGTTVTNNGNAFTISSGGGGGTGIQSVQSTDGTIAIQNPNGPVATIGIADGSVTPEKINPAGAGSGQALMYNGSSVQWSTPSGGGSGVSSINNASGALTLAASGGATVSTNGKTITINAGSGSGGTGIQGVQNTDNTLDITNPGGPTATINMKNQGITTTKLADGSVTNAKIPAGQVVKSINTLKDDVTLTAGNNVTITPSGNTLTIASTAAGNNVWAANGNNISNTNTGNVGLGTVNPLSKLHVISEANALPPRLESSGTTGFASGLDFYHGTTGKGYIGAPDASAAFAPDEMLVFGGTGTKTSLWANGQRALTISLSGHLGIGTASPSYNLQVETSEASAIYANNSDGPYAMLAGWEDGVYGNSYTGIGVYGYSNSTGNGVQGHSAAGFGVKCEGNGTYTGAWTNSSDIRMKKDIVPLRDALSNLLKLRGVYYYWRMDEFPGENFFPTRQIGVIAQEVEPLYPELVVTDKRGYKSVDYTKLTPILLEAIKEQQRMIEGQKNTIETLTKSNASFNERLSLLEKMLKQTLVQTNTASLRINE